MDLYLINAATDAKRQPRLGMTEGDANWRRKAPQCKPRACHSREGGNLPFQRGLLNGSSLFSI
jgi:hypothetical protein